MPELSVAQVLNGADFGLNFGFEDLTIANVNGRTLVFAYARIDGQLVELEMNDTGQLSIADTLSLYGAPIIGQSPEVAVLGSGTTVILSGYARTGNGILLGLTGDLSSQGDLAGVDEIFATSVFQMNGLDYLVSADGADGLTVYSDSGLVLQPLSSLDDAVDRYLADVTGTAAIERATSAQIVAASESEAGLTLLNVAANGSMAVADTLGPAEGFSVSGTLAVESLSLKDGAYVAIAATGSSSLSVVRVAASGIMQQTDHVLDSTKTFFQGATDIAATSVGDFSFLVAGGSDGGVSLLTVLPGGHLILLDTIADSATTTLSRIGGLDMAATSGALQIVASSPWEGGLTRLSYDISALGSVMIAGPIDATLSGTMLDDQLIGSGSANLIQGGGGSDILYDGAGRDTMIGGDGADLFVFEADGVVDYVQDFDLMEDRLDLSSYDFLYSVDQLQIAPTASGARLTFQSEVIEVTSSSGMSLTAEDFTDEMLFNLDRPPQATLTRTLQGGPFDDVLFGAEGFDTISGGDGADTIFGNGGYDLLQGDGGNDQIDGGSGADTIKGGAGADSLSGGLGDDLIEGGAGGDIIYGDAHDWVDVV